MYKFNNKMEIKLILSLMNLTHRLNISWIKEDESKNNIYVNSSENYIDNDRDSIPMFPIEQQMLLEYCMIISSICLVLHLIVYSFVPKLRNTPGKCLMSLSISLLIVKLTFLVSFHIKQSPHSILCILLSIARLYSHLG